MTTTVRTTGGGVRPSPTPATSPTETRRVDPGAVTETPPAEPLARFDRNATTTNTSAGTARFNPTVSARIEGAGAAVRAYFSNKTNVATVALSATRGGLSGAKFLLRGMPVVGSVINAASALVSVARACVRTAALVNNEKGVDGRDVLVAWGSVATDVAGIFIPPIGLAGSAGSLAYTVYDAVEEKRAERASDPA